MFRLTVVVLAFLLASCSQFRQDMVYEPPVVSKSQLDKEIVGFPPLDGEPMTIAVYGFADKTGQRKASQKLSLLSTAVTQGADSWIVNSLRLFGDGTWFKVLERAGLDNLVKERQIIRTTRDIYKTANKADALPPLLFAALLLEGGITGYDSNITTGGAGARFLGIGGSIEHRRDQVMTSMRLVSVQTGQILLAVNVEKVIYSTSVGADVFKFVDAGTEALELQAGVAENEPVSFAVRLAVEAGILMLVKQGIEQKLWRHKPTDSVKHNLLEHQKSQDANQQELSNEDLENKFKLSHSIQPLKAVEKEAPSIAVIPLVYNDTKEVTPNKKNNKQKSRLRSSEALK
jgi:curli production assembly/transport component CsgG